MASKVKSYQTCLYCYHDVVGTYVEKIALGLQNLLC